MSFTEYLPDMIRLGVADMQEAVNNPNIKINMDYWWRPAMDGELCQVCLAGAVLAARAEVININRYFDYIAPIDTDISHVFILDNVRNGDIPTFYIVDLLLISQEKKLSELAKLENNNYWIHYDSDKKHIPFSVMLEMADDIEQWFLDFGLEDYVRENKDPNLELPSDEELDALDNLELDHYVNRS